MKALKITDSAWMWMNIAVDADDIVVSGIATAFGGDSDPEDDGSTASGYSTKGHPTLIACSLPMRRDDIHDSPRHGRVLRNSPIPNLPFGMDAKGRDNPHGAHADVTFKNGLVIPNIPVIDLGPAGWTKHAVDLTVAAARKYQATATANNFESSVTYRIKGMAKFIDPALVA